MIHKQNSKYPQSDLSTLFRVGMGLIASAIPVVADPAGINPGTFIRPAPPVFCFRFTDIERLQNGGPNAFVFEFEVLNWSNQTAAGVALATTVGTTAGGNTLAPYFLANGIDPNGRGGPLGGFDIGPGRYDGDGLAPHPSNPQLGAIHGGRGRGDIPNALNDWDTFSNTTTAANWAKGTGTSIPNFDILSQTLTQQQIDAYFPPNMALDQRGDSIVDGGPGVSVGSGRNVLDGFTFTVADFNIGETLSFNWLLLGESGQPIGSPNQGNPMGFGVVNLVRLNTGTTPLPGAIFQGNTGVLTTGNNFFDGVSRIPNPAQFGVEFGAGILASFSVPTDNTFGVSVNTTSIPDGAGTHWLLAIAGLSLIVQLKTRR